MKMRYIDPGIHLDTRPMKTAEEKIAFKNSFFKLGQGRLMDRGDVAFWSIFWNTPQSASDIYDLLTPFDLQTVRDQNLPNFLLLVHIVACRVVELARDLSPTQHMPLLNCLRLLAKVLPYLFELPDYAETIENPLFWERNFNPRDFFNQPAAPALVLPRNSSFADVSENVLGADLVLALVRLLVAQGFTVAEPYPELPPDMCLWEPGICVPGKYHLPNPIHDSNRTEVLRVLLVLASTTFYEKVLDTVRTGLRFLTFLVAGLASLEINTLTANLTNILCRSARTGLDDSGLKYDNSSLVEGRHLCVSYSAELLACMVVCPMPSSAHTAFMTNLGLCSHKPYNMVRFYLGSQKNNDLVFLVSHLLSILKHPFSVNRLENRGKFTKPHPSPWAIEAIMILWELLQCNQYLRLFVAERLVVKLVPYIAYHIFAFCDVPHYKVLVKLCAYFLLYISSQETWVQALVLPMSENMNEVLPSEFRLTGGPHSTRDFLIVQLCLILSYVFSGFGSNPKSDIANEMKRFLVPTFLEVLYNIVPVVNDSIVGTDDTSKRMNNVNSKGGLSYQACSALLQLMSTLSSKQALAESYRNAEFLALILRALCSAATKNPVPSRMLLFSFVKNEKIYDSIWTSIYSLESENINGEPLRLMNVQEDDEENEDSPVNFQARGNDSLQMNMHAQRELPKSLLKSPDEYSISSFTSTEEIASPLYQSFNSSTASIGPEERDESFTEEKELENALRPKPPAGMSQKAKEKLPQDTPLSKAWGGKNALSVIITVLIPEIKAKLKDLWIKRDECNYDNYFIVQQIEHADVDKTIMENKKELIYDLMPDTPVDRLVFSWNYLSLGWYISVLYWDIYNTQENIKAHVGSNTSLMNSISSSIAVFSKFASSWSGLGSRHLDNTSELGFITDHVDRALTTHNVWSHTNVRLFKINLNDGDKFFNALGLKFGQSALSNNNVNDITHSLARRFSDFRMNSRSSVISQSSFHLALDELQERPRLSNRNSVSSLHSLNTLNRSRSNTPRNSVSFS